MKKPSIPPVEMQRFELQRSIGEMTARYVSDTAAPADIQQFETDFAALAFAIIAPSQPRTAKVRERGALPQLKRVPGPRRLSFGPLRRMAKRVGPRALRYIMKVGSDQSMEYFRLELRARLDKEFPQGNFYKRLGEDLDVIRFGHAVLTIERDTGVTRGKAYEIAAQAMTIKAASGRSLERDFQRFKRLCRRIGYVPHPLQSTGSRPCFSLNDLDGRTSAKSLK